MRKSVNCTNSYCTCIIMLKYIRLLLNSIRFVACVHASNCITLSDLLVVVATYSLSTPIFCLRSAVHGGTAIRHTVGKSNYLRRVAISNADVGNRWSRYWCRESSCSSISSISSSSLSIISISILAVVIIIFYFASHSLICTSDFKEGL